MRYTAKNNNLDIDAEVDWPEGPLWEAENVNEFSVKSVFEKDALWLPIEDFIEKYHITKIYRLGKSYCGKTYYDAVGKRWLEGDALDAFLQQTGSMESC